MSFQQGLSGLNVSAKALDAIGNNIANASTVGYKSAQVLFADVYAAALSGGGASQIGIGASAPAVSQTFTQGNITTTNNPLDLSINGGGFFVLNQGGANVYSRNGQFNVDKEGFIVNSSGMRLQGYPAGSTSGTPVDMQLMTTNIQPNATTSSSIQLNLDSRAVPPVAMRPGTLAGSVIPTTLNITAANNTINLNVDGMPLNSSVAIELPVRNYPTVGDLMNALEQAINENPTLAAANAQVDVTRNTSGNLVITSRSVGTLGSQGYGSSVTISGGDGVANLFGTPISTPGVDRFDPARPESYTSSTSQTVYDTLGNPHNLTMYFSKTSLVNNWQLYTSLNGEFYPVGAGTEGTLTGGTYVANAADSGGTLDLTIDGVSQSVTVPAGTYATADALATAINNAGLTGATASAMAGRVVITSATTGTTSSVVATSSPFSDAVFGNTTTSGTLTGNAYVANAADAGGTLDLTVDGTAQTVTVPAGTYPDAAALATAINTAGLTGATASAVGGAIVITSNTTGATSSVTAASSPFADAVFGNTTTSGTLTGNAYVANAADAGGTLDLTVDGTAQTVTVPAGTYPDAAALATAINTAGLTGATASAVGGAIVITSNTTGATSSVSVTGSAFADAVFGNTTTPATLTGDVAYVANAADAGGDLILTIDGVEQTVTVPAGTYATAADLAAAIDGLLTGATATEVGGVIVITSATTGANSSVTVASSAFADAVFGPAPVSVSGPIAVAGADSTPPVSLVGTAVIAWTADAGEAGQPQAQILTFSPVGNLLTEMPLEMNFDPRTGAELLDFTLDFTGSSQYGVSFGVNQLVQDGYTSGRLAGLSISGDGIIQGRYSNGKSQDMGQILLVTFNNPNGLSSLGGNVWAETSESGQAIPGIPGQGSLGSIQSAAVEESNVDLTAELVNMITMQRIYQANAQTIKTQDQVLQTLVNLR